MSASPAATRQNFRDEPIDSFRSTVIRSSKAALRASAGAHAARAGAWSLAQPRVACDQSDGALPVELVSREQSLQLLDDFAKWLFPTAAVVGTLGASFAVSDANSLTGVGRNMFALALAALGLASLSQRSPGSRFRRERG